jgi:hypothetical protein
MHDFISYLMLLGALGSNGSLPFWAVSNQYGLMPENNGVLAVAAARTSFDDSKTFQWQWGVSLAYNGSAMVDELYVDGRWKCIRLDLGMQHRDRDFLGADASLGSLSTSSGHLVESGNSRSMPGYNLVVEPWSIPGLHDHLWVSGEWGDYTTIDKRYVQGALVHRTKFALRYDINKAFFLQIGLDHYALWGGDSPIYGKMPITFNNYFRVVTGSHASSSGTISDQINVIGDQGGAEHFKFGYRGESYNITFQAEKPYNDGSGMGHQNFPDGLYTLHFSMKDKSRWISDVLCEYIYTMWQSGTRHETYGPDGKVIILGGLDNYFTNGEYRSGWTHFGNAICSPMFFTGDRNGDGIIEVENNRIRGIHLGLSGSLFKAAPYRLMVTYSKNYGTYPRPYISPSAMHTDWKWWRRDDIDKPLRQLSVGFTTQYTFASSRQRNPHFTLTGGVFYDKGSFTGSPFGFTLGMKCSLQKFNK